MNFAGVWKLPVVFIVNNNQWAISVPLRRQTASQTLAQKAIAAGFSVFVFAVLLPAPVFLLCHCLHRSF
jgi:TPP-dependent pyruvate/acetoin dehydrogenase alpha subunit